MIRPVVRAAATIALAIVLAHCTPSAGSLDRLYGEAEQQLRRGQLDLALATADRGRAQAESAGDPLRVWRFGLLTADARIARLEFARALEWLEREVPADPGFATIKARQLILLARTRVAQGQVAAAQPILDQARPLAADDPDARIELELLQAQLLYRTGRPQEADALLAAARERVSGQRDGYRQAQVSTTMGMGLVTRGRYDEALPYFERILDAADVKGTIVHGAALNNAGLCHARLGQFERAIELQQQAVNVQQQGRRRDYAQALGELGSTYLLKEELPRSVDYLQQAFNIAAEGELAADAALFARNLAAAYTVMNKWDEAAHFHRQAAQFADRIGTPSPYAVVTEARIAAGRGRTDEAARLFKAAQSEPKATPGARWMSHEGLARLATTAGDSAEAARQFESALQIVEQTRSSLLRADDRISFTSRLLAFYRGYVELLLAQKQIDRALEVADASRARVLAERQGVAAPAARATAASLKQLARTSDTALLFYWLGPEQSWLWTVTGDAVTATSLPPAPQIAALVTEHQAAIQNALADPLTASGSAGERLYQLLVQPVAAAVARHRSVVIVPDGPLHRLNFETLLVPDPAGASGGSSSTPGRHYWIDDLMVQIAPSLAMLRAASSKAPASGSLLLVGNAPARPPDFPALTYAAAEMSAIRKQFAADGVSVVDGAAASPEAFKSAAPERFSVIHFTSHAVANTESPLDSAVILSGPDQAYKLYARDVAALPLTSELVTVSACRSAGERAYAGEGLVGFAWAFLRAGSRRVVAGLWDVDDRSTAALMEQMYARIAAGDSPPAALREAKRMLIKNGYARPYHWAPFQMFTVVI